MTTRGRIARGEHQQEFEGHVQRWVKQWEPLGGTSKVKVLKWVPTGDRSEAPAASRVPHLKTVRDSSLKVVFRPKQAPRPPDQPQAAQDMPSSNGVAAKAEAEQPHHSSAQPDAAVPMEVETAKAENAQEQSRILEQQSMPMQESLPGNEAEEQYQRTDVPVELPASAASGPAHKPDRALAEQAANTTLAALNGGAAAHPTTADAEHAATPSLPMEADMPMAAQAADDILAEPHAVSAAPVGSDAVIIAQNGNASEMGSAGS